MRLATNQCLKFAEMMTLLGIIILFAMVRCSTRPENQGSLQGPCAHSSSRLNCVQFVSVYDGDTMTFNIPGTHPLFGENAKIRLLGVDAPEIRTKNACEKTAALKARKTVEDALTRARRIDLVDIQRGKYFRVVAEVMVDGEPLSQKLLTRKLAYRYDGGRKLANIDWCLH